MLKRLSVATLVAATLAGPLAYRASAQITGVAFAALGTGSPFEGFFGPWKPTASGMDISYFVLCYDTVNVPRRRVGGEVIVSIPDGASLGDFRTLATTAIVNSCGSMGVTVPRGAVILPSIILGQ